MYGVLVCTWATVAYLLGDFGGFIPDRTDQTDRTTASANCSPEGIPDNEHRKIAIPALHHDLHCQDGDGMHMY
jgi:hypothetical protein